MVKSYCKYGIYNEDTAQSVEKGEDLNRIIYWDDGKRMTFENVIVEDITGETITIELEDGEQVTLQIEDICDWD